MQGSTVAAIASIVIVGSLVVGGTFYTIQQNQASVTSLNNQVNGLDNQITNLNAQVASLAQRTVQVVTVQNTIVTVETQTQTVTDTVTSTSIVYPIPGNITVSFTQASYGPSYQIVTATTNISGRIGGSSLSIPLNNLYQGEQVTVNVSCDSVGGQYLLTQLYVNSQMVAQTTCVFSSTAQIVYNV